MRLSDFFCCYSNSLVKNVRYQRLSDTDGATELTGAESLLSPIDELMQATTVDKFVDIFKDNIETILDTDDKTEHKKLVNHFKTLAPKPQQAEALYKDIINHLVMHMLTLQEERRILPMLNQIHALADPSPLRQSITSDVLESIRIIKAPISRTAQAIQIQLNRGPH